jgi:hypothetical protein
MTWPLALHVLEAIPGDSFDGWQNYWNLWWIKIALVDRVASPYFTDLLYYPTGVDLYFHTLNPFNGLVTLPVQLSAGLLAAYNTAVLLSWVLAGYGVYLLTRWVIGRGMAGLAHNSGAAHVAAFVSGVIFTFSPFHMAHLLGHMQVMALEWIPFYLLALLRSMEASKRGRPWLRSALMAGLFLIFCGLCDWYFVLYLLLFTPLAWIWAWLSPGGRASPALAVVRPALAAGLLFAVILSPILAPMVREATRYSFMVRPASDLYVFSASLADFFVPNRLHTLLRPDSYAWIGNQIAPPSERTISIGYVALALAALALWRAPRRAALWIGVAALFVMLALGPRWHAGFILAKDLPSAKAIASAPPEWTPLTLLNQAIPFMRISRSVSRYALMVQLAMAVLAGIGLAAWSQRYRRRGWLLAVGALGLALAEYWVAPYPISPPDTPAYYAQLAGGQGAVLNLPMNYDRPGYLLYQTVHQRPLTTAYISRDDPRTLVERVPVLQHFRHLGPDIIEADPAQVGMTVLQDLGVESVVLDRYKMPGGEERTYTEEVAQQIFGGQTPLFEDERITVYSVAAVEEPAAYALLGPLNWGPLLQDGKIRSRQLGDGPAEVWVRHALPGTALCLQYRSDADTWIEISDSLGQVLAALPPTSEESVTGEIDLARFSSANASDEVRVALMSRGSGTVIVESIALAANEQSRCQY